MTESTPSFPQTLFQPEAGACQVLLVRHGQSAPYRPGQPFDLIDGHGDPHLTELGHHQANLVGDRLANEPIAALYASTLTRTQQTAAPLAAKLGLDPVIEHDLREIYMGDFEGGQLRQHAAEGHPAVLAMRANREWGEIPGGETNAELAARTVDTITRIGISHRDQMVAVFVHGGVIGAILGHIAESNPFVFAGARHTSISHIIVDDAGWVIRSFNDGAHSGRLTVDHQVGSQS